jgi:hypothetical protein
MQIQSKKKPLAQIPCVMVSQANPFGEKNVTNFTTHEIIGRVDKMTHAKGTFTHGVRDSSVESPNIMCSHLGLKPTYYVDFI